MKNTTLIIGATVLAGAIILGAQMMTNGAETLSEETNKTHMLATVAVTKFETDFNKDGRIVIDVRTAGEYEEGHIEGSKNIDFYSDTFQEELRALDANASYSIYCRSGNRSGQTLQIMKALGFADVIDLDGGVLAWEGKGNSLCTDC